MLQASDVQHLIDELKVIEQEAWSEKLNLLWMSGVPMNAEGDGDDGSSGGSGDDGDSGDGDDGDDSDDDEGKTPEQIAIDKAHTKLRDAEKREKAAIKRAEAAERSKLSAADAEKARADAAEAKVAEYEEKEQRVEALKDMAKIAKSLKFTNPEAAAKRFLPKVGATEREMKDALKEALEDFPSLAGDGTPPPPVNETKNGGSTSDFSRDIRRAAGRQG